MAPNPNLKIAIGSSAVDAEETLEEPRRSLAFS
jgi:hypothetical protein